MKVTVLSIALCLLTLVSCGLSEEDMMRLAKLEFENKVKLLEQERSLICNKDADARAEILADSIIRELRINPLKDSLYRPFVPPKPTYVETDSTVVNSKQSVKPILESDEIKR